MRRLSFLTATGLLMLWLTGCEAAPGGDTTAQSPAADASPGATIPSPGATAPASPVPGQSPAAQNPALPTVAVSPSPAGILPPDLINSTDPDQRVRSIQRNRPDPFALVPTTPVIERTEQPQPQPEPAPVNPPQTVPPPDLGELSPVEPDNTVPPPPLPPPPQPTLARAVEVTGVVQIGGTIHAIVKAPNEPTSRYVRAGQYLANGRVLVKRIDVNQADPVVVLEENGIEVVTAVGEGGASPSPGVPTAVAIAPPILAAFR